MFAALEVTVLGHVVSSAGVSPDPEKNCAVAHFPQPRTPKELQSFLCLCSYFRRFVHGFATIAAPLHQLLQKHSQFVWTEDCALTFHSLRQVLTTAPVLSHFNQNAPTSIHTDASGYGLGAVLLQRHHKSASDQVIAYASRTLTTPEKNYSTTELECLAVAWAVTKFRLYLFGRFFNIITDHHALCWLTSLKSVSGRLGRWAPRLQEYDFLIIHKSGRKHTDADGLSRSPLPPSEAVLPVSLSATVPDIDILSAISVDSFIEAQRADN